MVGALGGAAETEVNESRDRIVVSASRTPRGLGEGGDLDLAALTAAGEHLAKLRGDEFAMIAERALEASRSVGRFAEAKTRGEHGKACRRIGQRVGLQTGCDLELVLGIAEEEIKRYLGGVN